MKRPRTVGADFSCMRWVGAALVALVAVPVAAPSALAAPTSVAPSQAQQHYVVQFERGVDASREARSIQSAGGEVDRVLKHVFPGAVARLSSAAAEAVRRNPRVKALEPAVPVSLETTRSPAVWGLDRLDQRALPLSGTFTSGATGTGVDVFVLDTGVRADHVELTGSVTAGYSVFEDLLATSDCHGHGTHVAGTVASTTYGVAPDATVVPVRVLDCDGFGSSLGIVTAIDWVIASRSPDRPAVINMSLGGGASSMMDDAVQAAHDAAITVVAAAGNSQTDACTTSPARATAAVTVAATDSTDARASYSNYGTCVDLFGPGSGITSTLPGSSTATGVMSGTSMAAPHVAGAAALLLQSDPSLDPAAVVAALTTTATTGVVRDRGTGSPDLLLHVADEPPAAPTDVRATAGDRSADVSWSAAAGSAAVTGYTVTAAPGGAATSVTGTARTAHVTGLESGTAYTFTVRATSAGGTSAPSAASDAVTPFNPVARYVTAVYRDLFQREPDPDGLTHWTSALTSGTPYGEVANAITYSHESRTKLITAAYGSFLGRAPDPGGLAHWLQRMDEGMHVQQLQASFLTSPEYYDRSGGRDDAWVSALYQDVLARLPAPSEVAGWEQVLDLGASRHHVALGFLYSSEHLATVLEGYYQQLLGRSLDESGRSHWIAALQAGRRVEEIVAGIVSSEEYRIRVLL